MADQDLPGLDAEITDLSPDIRKDLAEKGKSDLYFFAKGIMGYKQMVPHVHLPLCMFFDEHPGRFKLVLMPRGHYKTSVNIARVTQMAVRNPNARILFLNEVAENAEGFLGTIKEHFESNAIMRSLYSSVIPKNYRATKWNSKELRLVRDWKGPQATIEAMGMNSTLTSNHFTHMAIDDPISEDAVKSASVMGDAILRLGKIFSLMVEPEKDTFDFVGTPWALYDVYTWLQRKFGDKLARYICPVLKDGQPIFPELMSLETLAQIRSTIEEYQFSCQYMLRPRDVANQDFNVGDLRFWRWSRDGQAVVLFERDGTVKCEWPIGKLDITTSVDLAVSEKITNDCNAIVTVGCSPDGEAIVLDTFVKRCTPLQVIEHLFTLKSRFMVRAFGIEGVAYQKAFKYFLKAECERRMEYMNIIELKAIPSKRGTGNNSKEMRIRGLQPIAATGRLYVLPTQHELRNELADFPLGEHDDCIDALAHQLVMWRGLLSQERIAKYKRAESRLIQRINSGELYPSLIGPPSRNPQDIPHPDDLGIELPEFGEMATVEMA